MALELSWLRWQEMKTHQTHTQKKTGISWVMHSDRGTSAAWKLSTFATRSWWGVHLPWWGGEYIFYRWQEGGTFYAADAEEGLANLASGHLSMRAVLGFSHTGRENWDRYVLHSQSTPYLDQGKALAFLWVWPRKGLTIATGLVSLTRRWSCQNCTPPQDFSVLRTVHRWNDGVPETKWSRAVFSHLTAGSHACCHPT